jgi:hypothetical protein
MNCLFAGGDALGRAVPLLSLGRGAVDLDELRVIDIAAESLFSSFHIDLKAIAAALRARVEKLDGIRITAIEEAPIYLISVIFKDE